MTGRTENIIRNVGDSYMDNHEHKFNLSGFCQWERKTDKEKYTVYQHVRECECGEVQESDVRRLEK